MADDEDPRIDGEVWRSGFDAGSTGARVVGKEVWAQVSFWGSAITEHGPAKLPQMAHCGQGPAVGEGTVLLCLLCS